MIFATTAVISLLATLGATQSPAPPNYGVWRDVSITSTSGNVSRETSQTVTAEYTHFNATAPIFATCQLSPIISGEDFARTVCHPSSFSYSLDTFEVNENYKVLSISLHQRVTVGGQSMMVTGTSGRFEQSCGGGEREVCMAKRVIVVADRRADESQ